MKGQTGLTLANQWYKYSFHQMKQNKDQSLVCAEEQLRRIFIREILLKV